MFRRLKDLSATEYSELQDCIEALYELLPLTDDVDEVWFRNRLRHILEDILTDDAYDKLVS